MEHDAVLRFEKDTDLKSKVRLECCCVGELFSFSVFYLRQLQDYALGVASSFFLTVVLCGLESLGRTRCDATTRKLVITAAFEANVFCSSRARRPAARHTTSEGAVHAAKDARGARRRGARPPFWWEGRGLTRGSP